MTRCALALTVAAGLIAASEAPGRSTGVSQSQLDDLVERRVAGARFLTPPDFIIERVTPPDRTDSYVALTFDSRGRLAVSKENDFPRLLLDADGDGILQTEKILSDDVRNCQGLWFDGDDMADTSRHWPSPVLWASTARTPFGAARRAAGW